MKRYNYTGLLEFANTAAGKFASVVVAVVMVLSLSSIALAVDGAVQDRSNVAPTEGEGANSSLSDTNGQAGYEEGSEIGFSNTNDQDGISGEDVASNGTSGEEVALGEGVAPAAVNGEPVDPEADLLAAGGSTPVPGEDNDTSNGEGNDAGGDTGNGDGNDTGNDDANGAGAIDPNNQGNEDPTGTDPNNFNVEADANNPIDPVNPAQGIDSDNTVNLNNDASSVDGTADPSLNAVSDYVEPLSDDEVYMAIRTMEDTDQGNDSGLQINSARVSFAANNCTVKVADQAIPAKSTRTVDVPLMKDLVFTIEPDEGYVLTLESVTGQSPRVGTLLSFWPEEDGSYVVPGDFVDSNLAIFATAEAIDPNNPNQVEDPLPIDEDTEVVPDGFYDAPVITVPDVTYTYNGTPQPAEAMYVEPEVTGLQEGDQLVLTGFTGAAPVNATNGNPATITFTDYTIFRGGEVFTSKYKPATFAKAEVKVTIEKAPLTVVTPSAEKVYDGTPLTYAGSIETGDAATLETLWNADAPSAEDFQVTGSQTEVGSSLNTYRLSPAFLNTIRDNYTLQENLGTLTVLPSEGPAIIAPSNSKLYDGKRLRAGKPIAVGLPDGYSIKASVLGGPIKSVGKVTTRIEPRSVVILDADGKDVTSSFGDFELVSGELEISPVPLYVVTESASKTDDGTALEAGGRIRGFVKGETANFKVTGRQVEPGTSVNTYNIDWNGTARARNYNVVEDLGTLTINAAEGAASGGSDGEGSTGGTTTTTPREITYVTAASAGNTTGAATGAGATAAAGAGAATASDNASSSGFRPSATLPEPENAGQDNAESGNSEEDSGIDPTIETVATGMQNAEQILRGEEPTPLAAPAVEETLADNETPLGVFDAPADCWVHWYSILGLIITAAYGGVVMFFRRAYAYELELREADVLGVPVGMAQPRVPVPNQGASPSSAQGGQAGRGA